MTATSTPDTALVTGASSGIGATYADRLAARGHDLILVARDAGRLRRLADEIVARHGVRADILPADLTARAGVADVEDRLRSDAGITLFVNNAGIGPQGPTLQSDLDQLDLMVTLNVAAANRLALAAAHAFRTRGRGTIVNTASVVAFIPERFNATYSATKAFMLNLSLGLASELKDTGVRVQAVLPGLTRTEIFERAGFDTSRLDPSMVMEVGDMVDAALAGLDLGELVTIPSLPDAGQYDALVAARLAMAPNLSRDVPATRYRTAAAAPA